MKVLVTGAAGFIGFHLVRALLKRGDHVIGVDSINDYYDTKLKNSRLEILNTDQNTKSFIFIREDLKNSEEISEIFKKYQIEVVVNLAAQAGVRYSINNPHSYIDSNVVGFLNILESCKKFNIKHLIYASSSSVYGMNIKQPFSTDDITDYPISLYAATKKTNELMAHAYSHLYDIPTTGLRFFTVYGPYGRPDMAYFKFTKSILEGKPINIFNHGKMERDFTYIDDVIIGLMAVIDSKPKTKNNIHSRTNPPYRIYNIGNNQPISIDRFINAIENSCNAAAIKKFLPMQPGDVPSTYASVDDLYNDYGFKPMTSIEDGVNMFVSWYKEFYNHQNF